MRTCENQVINYTSKEKKMSSYNFIMEKCLEKNSLPHFVKKKKISVEKIDGAESLVFNLTKFFQKYISF